MIQSIKDKIKQWLSNSFSFTKKVCLPGFEGISVYETSIYLYNGLKKNSIIDRAYSISYKFLIASFPLIIFLFSLIPHIPITGLQDEILQSILSAMPDQLSSYLKGFFEDLLLHKKTAILSLGFLLTIFFASNTMNAVLKGFSSSYHLNRMKRKSIHIRLWSIALMFIFGTILILASLVFILGGLLIDYLQETAFIQSSIEIWAVWLIEWILIFLLFIIAVSILYNVGNAEKEKWKFFSPGVIFSSIMIWLFSEAFSFFLTYIAPFNKLYGSLGTIIILLLFIYYFFAILLIGFELNLSIQSASKMKKIKQSST
jgi:membrane protein